MMSYRDVFRALNDEEIAYVVPRRYDRLPEDTIDGGDVDIIIEPSQYRVAVDCCRSVDFSTEDDASNRLRIYRSALTKPKKVLRVFAREPKKSVWKILTGNGTQIGNPRHENTQLYRDSQMLDLRNNLAYESPMNGSRIPVDPSVTTGMLTRRERVRCFYTPAPADELAHLVSHCVFNKYGEFPRYYTNRCDQLFRTVHSDSDQLELFEDLLEEIFFGADQLVFDLVAEKRYSDIREDLRKFSDY